MGGSRAFRWFGQSKFAAAPPTRLERERLRDPVAPIAARTQKVRVEGSGIAWRRTAPLVPGRPAALNVVVTDVLEVW